LHSHRVSGRQAGRQVGRRAGKQASGQATVQAGSGSQHTNNAGFWGLPGVDKVILHTCERSFAKKDKKKPKKRKKKRNFSKAIFATFFVEDLLPLFMSPHTKF
jgi:hypothetical protein